ncbi:YceI family protein [Salsipaludibacter albus]|uniref:YceI family protein n=1 Tax=Salsipaludibacter albus TaxID=2849650 RepID=UPI001EE457D8|nr:YceI family protein [Salsipaludibacter albus]MBY5162415.1 YceI family protein [Salsipaludibacter albus]
MASTDPAPSTTRRTVLIVVGVVLVAGIAAAVWWFTRPEAATVDIDNALGAATASPTATPSVAPTPTPSPTPSASPTTSPTPTADPSPEPSASPTAAPAATGQAWDVTTDAVAYDFASAAGTFVGFRIDEELSNIGATTAVGRTPAVTGRFVLDDTTITSGEFTADLGQLTTDRGQRTRAMLGAVEAAEFPEATFVQTDPAELDAVPPVGEVVEVTVTGDLTIAGETNPVDIPLQAALTEAELLVVTGSFDVALADWGIDTPSAPIVVSVADTATVELQLYLQPGETTAIE